MAQLTVKKELNAYKQFQKEQAIKNIGKGCLKVLSWIGIALVMIVCGFFYFAKSCLDTKG